MFTGKKAVVSGAILGALALTMCAVETQADFYLIRRIDLTPHFGPLGNNPITMTTDGTYAYVGGYRATADVGTIGILKINLSDPDDFTALEPGGTQLVGQFRYYGGLVYRDGILYALTDRPDGTLNNTNVRAIDVSTGALVPGFWGDFEDGAGIVYQPAILTQGPALGGLALDPGFGPTHDGTGISIMAYNSGRRGLIDFVEGKTIYDFAAAMIVADVTGSCTVADATSWRDHVYTPGGTVLTRRSNQVQRSVRTGANAIGGYTHLTDALNLDGTPRIDCGDGRPLQLRSSASIIGQNLESIPATSAGAEGSDLIIFNDRYNNTARSFADVVKIIDTNGVNLTATVQLLKADGSTLDTSTLPDGIGLYDFYYDAANDQLLLLDFTVRDLYVFSASAPTCNTPAQDADGDGDVDLADNEAFVDCLNGPNEFFWPFAFNQAACPCLDDDGDGDVDLKDFAAFQAAFDAI